VSEGDHGSDLERALVDLQAAPERPYYDEAADTAARTSYYAELDTTAAPADLYRALGELLTRTHEPRPHYRPATNVYPWVDLHEDLRLRSIYSGKDIDPQQAIQEDFEAERQRAAHLQESLAAQPALVPQDVAAATADAEAAFPYNCEHVVCQSWFGRLEPMRGDIHHGFACEPNCNSFRGNTPYFDFPELEEVVREDCGHREQTQFEPGTAKGAVARATLYFLLRYPHTILGDALRHDDFTGDLRALLAERLPTLLTWHEAEPVTRFELHRNAATQEVQGNRNPLIDLPELAAGADFTLALAV
jgi:endonuclease G